MRRSLAFLLLFIVAGCATAQPDLVYRAGGLTVRLTQVDCALPRQAMVLAANGGLAVAKAANVTQNGKEYRACWVIDADNDVLIADEHGRGGYLPARAFKPAETV